MSSPKALREWCRHTCAYYYPNVDIKNMSTSFRDGLAFCAIIHKHRPDLIDFSSLSKENVYQNNKLAFETAETKLGIPALLDPNDMVSSKVPDCLGIITYLSQYYFFFNKKSFAGLSSLTLSHIPALNNLPNRKTPDGLQPQNSVTDPETRQEDSLSNPRPGRVCHMCFKPVHLIQRHLIDGKVYHRSCFRCRECHSTLLAGSYTQGSDAGILFCTDHLTDSKCTRVELNQQIGSAENSPKCQHPASYISLGGLAVTSVPHYKTESQVSLVCKTQEAEGKDRQEESSTEVRKRENRQTTVVKKPARSHLPPPPVVKDSAVEIAAPIQADSTTKQEVTKAGEPSELRVTEGTSRPVPSPRRMLDSSSVPVPAPRTKTYQTMNTSSGNSTDKNECSPKSFHVTGQTSGSPQVKTNHPWLAIVHPGPWTQLPPAPPPVPTPRSKSLSSLQGSWYRPRVTPPNPFAEDLDEEKTQKEVTKPESADPAEPSEAAVHSGNVGNLTDQSEDGNVACSSDAGNTAIHAMTQDFKEAGGVPAGEVGAADTNNVEASSETVGDTSSIGSSDEAQCHILSKSLSVPALAPARCQSSLLPVDWIEANEDQEQETSCNNKPACKENPFDRKTAMPRSKTFQALPSTRAPAPGHGFPLIKRKVQTDQNVSTKDLQVEMRELNKRLESLEQTGVELERNLRHCKNDEEEEQMLMGLFSLVHKRHALVCRDTELVYLTKQQKLEERQADVEYNLRCLLNKPESDWSQEDRDQEQQLMDELVAIIEQRNQIISSMDQERQRERGEDMPVEATMKNAELQKERPKEQKKSKGKFKPTNVFKMLNYKAERTKDSVFKKS